MKRLREEPGDLTRMQHRLCSHGVFLTPFRLSFLVCKLGPFISILSQLVVSLQENMNKVSSTLWPSAQWLPVIIAVFFPGGPVARTPHSQCRVPDSVCGQGTRSHVLQLVHMLQLKVSSAAVKTEDSTCCSQIKIVNNLNKVKKKISPLP